MKDNEELYCTQYQTSVSKSKNEVPKELENDFGQPPHVSINDLCPKCGCEIVSSAVAIFCGNGCGWEVIL